MAHSISPFSLQYFKHDGVKRKNIYVDMVGDKIPTDYNEQSIKTYTFIDKQTEEQSIDKRGSQIGETEGSMVDEELTKEEKNWFDLEVLQ